MYNAKAYFIYTVTLRRKSRIKLQILLYDIQCILHHLLIISDLNFAQSAICWNSSKLDLKR